MGPARPHLTEKPEIYAAPREQNKKRLTVIIVTILVLLLVAAAIALPLYFAVLRPKSLAAANNNNNNNSNSNDGTNDTTTGNNTKTNNLITWGNDGTLVEMEDGNKFTYSNKFGGYWVFDPANPTNNSARAQSFSPALNEEFKYGVDRIRG